MSAGVPQCEFGTEQRADCVGAVPRHRQTAALLGSVERERSDDGVSTDVQSLPEPFRVGGLLLGRVEKVESRPVVPDIIPRLGAPRGDVCDNPFRPIGITTKSLSRRRECRGRQIEHCDILMPRG